MDINEKRRKLAYMHQAAELIGFGAFCMIEPQQAVIRGVPEKQLDRDAPAFYLPEFQLAVIYLDRIDEHRDYTNHIDFLFAHELSHFIQDAFIKDKQSTISQIAASHLESGLARLFSNSSSDASCLTIHQYVPELFECFTNLIAYRILSYFEDLKSGQILSHNIQGGMMGDADSEFVTTLFGGIEEYVNDRLENEIQR